MTDSPIPEPADPTDRKAAARALAWTTTVIVVATAFLFVFNAASMRSWASSRKPSEAAGKLVAATSAWETKTASAGLTEPRLRISHGWIWLRTRTWADVRHPDRPASPAS